MSKPTSIRCVIIYLSLAGNTRLAAQKVAAGLEAEGHETDLWEMRDVEGAQDALQTILGDSDLVGFMAPVYGFREPTIFRNFLEQMPSAPSANDGGFFPAFIGCTAADHVSNLFHSVNKRLVAKGYTTIGTLAVQAPRTYTVWNKPERDYTFQAAELEKAVSFGRQLPGLLENARAGGAPGSPGRPEIRSSLGDKINAALSGHDFTLRLLVGKIWVDETACTSCGTCVENCAWEALTMPPTSTGSADRVPVWNKKACGGCCACINLCPAGAVKNKKCEGKVRYHEPSFKGYHPRPLP